MELGRRAVQKAPKFDVVKDMLKHGNFRGAEGAEKVPPIMMNNISMLQMKEMVPNLHELGELRFERIETALSAVEDKVDQLLGKKYEVHEWWIEPALPGHVASGSYRPSLTAPCLLPLASSYWPPPRV